MRRLHILCEGQTEETVVRETLGPHFTVPGKVCVTYSVLKTKRSASGQASRGGVSTWPKIRTDLRNLLRDSSITVLTTMIDYYGVPDDTPGMVDCPTGTPWERVAHVERAVGTAVGDPRFLPHFVLHETESWVLACDEVLELVTGDPKLPEEVRTVVAEAGGPELVDGGRDTAPSKRLERLYPGYRKTSDGPDAIALAGLAHIRTRCPHTDRWPTAVEARLNG